MPERIHYYTDEHVANAVAEGLRRHGIQVVTTPEAGMIGASDVEQLDYAIQHGCVMVTQDVDYITLAYQTPHHSGIVYAPQGRTIGEIVATLLFIYNALTADDMRGHLEFI